MKLDEHPTVLKLRAREDTAGEPTPLDSDWLKKICSDCGADDAGFASLDHPLLAEDRERHLSALPGARAVISLVVRLNPASIRCPSNSTADVEYINGMKQADSIARKVVRTLRQKNVQGLNPSVGFPMDLENFPERMWPVAHKLTAEAAGLTRRGLSRLAMHPRFGNFIILASVLIDREISAYGEPLDHDPCVECKLCAAVCPTGAICPDGHFNFTSCLINNYRDRLQGFIYWVEQIIESRNVPDYRRRITDAETVSMWQALSYSISNKCSYCMSVCPAGEEVLGPYISDRKKFMAEVVRPLQQKPDVVYVVPGSDPEAHVAKRFPHKQARRISSALRPTSVRSFLSFLPLGFNREQAKDFCATYHFTFTGEEQIQSTVKIDSQTVEVSEGHVGKSDIRIRADSRTWLDFLAKEKGLLTALVTRRIRVGGSPALMKRFAQCFPL